MSYKESQYCPRDMEKGMSQKSPFYSGIILPFDLLGEIPDYVKDFNSFRDRLLNETNKNSDSYVAGDFLKRNLGIATTLGVTYLATRLDLSLDDLTNGFIAVNLYSFLTRLPSLVKSKLELVAKTEKNRGNSSKVESKSDSLTKKLDS